MPRRHRILIAAHDPGEREQWKSHLADLDCEFDLAEDGPSALAKVASFQPGVVLLDAMHPGGGGFELCKQIKRDFQSPRIVVAIVMQLADLGDIERAVEAGVDDFLSKPVNETELVRRVANLLRFLDA